MTLIGLMEKASRGQNRPATTAKGVNCIRVTECDKALMTISRVATLLNCVSASIIQGDLPKDTKIGDIGSALGLLYKILDEAYNTLYDAAN